MQKAHILGIDTLFDSIFAEDRDFQRLLPIAPAIISEMKEDYKARFEITTKELKLFQLKKSTERQEEIDLINQSLQDQKRSSDRECKAKIEIFQHEKKVLLKIVTNSRVTKEVDDALKSLREKAQQLSDYLMGAEIVLVEQFEEVLKEFERSYMELCNASTEFGQSSCSRLRELENEHQEKFTEAITAMCDRFSKGDIDEVDDEIRDVRDC